MRGKNRRPNRSQAFVPFHGQRPHQRLRRNPVSTGQANPLLWIVLGAVGVLVAYGAYRAFRASAPGKSNTSVARTKKPRPPVTIAPRREVLTPTSPEAAAEEEEDYSQAIDSPSESFPKQPLTDSGQGTLITIRDPSTASSPAQEAARPRKGVAAKKIAARPAAPTINNRFSMTLSGKLGNQDLDPNDSQTWARLSYALQSEAKQSHGLVRDGNAAATGGPNQPTYRLNVEAQSTKESGITFYGKQIGSRYRCQITATIQKLQGSDYAYLDSAAHVEEYTPTQDNDTEEKILRKVYDVALDRFAKELVKSRPCDGK